MDSWEIEKRIIEDLTNSINNEITNLAPSKIEFPRFNGETNPRIWYEECDMFFELYSIPERKKLLYASFHLEGKAKTWFHCYYQMMKRNGDDADWRSFGKDLVARFGNHDFHFQKLPRMQQRGSVSDYVEEFEECLSRVLFEHKEAEDGSFIACTLRKESVISKFLAGLKGDIGFEVERQNPSTLSEAIHMACVEENAMESEYYDKFRTLRALNRQK